MKDKKSHDASSVNSIVYGFHAVQTLIRENPDRIQKILLQTGREDQRLQQLQKIAQQQHLQWQVSSRQELDKLTAGENHQGIVAVCFAAEKTAHSLPTDIETVLEQLNEPAFLLILDGVQDPHNLGACLRSANAAGVHAVIAPKDRAVGITPVVRKVASGAAELTPFIQVTNLARTLQFLQEKGVWIYGAAEEGAENLFETDLKGSIAIVLGAEGTGLRRLTRDYCDKLIKIPTAGEISSLNVSVATGVCLFEALRQRSMKDRRI